MKRIHLYEKMYYSEYERKEKQNSKLSVLLTIYSILTALMSYNILSYKKICVPETVHATIILHFIIFGAILYIVSLYFAIRTFIGYSYSYLPSASTIEKAYNEQCEYFKDFYQSNESYFRSENITMKDLIDEQMEKILCDLYCKASTHNFLQNNIKTKYLSLCMYFLGAIIIETLICSLYLQFLL